ncbi:MAG: type II toxin-antitoxin system RelE/ParE family toxin [Bacteroidales bacterium]
MPEKIIWSPLAEEDLGNILEYLSKNWNQKVIIQFLNKIEFVMGQISKTPNQFPVINKKLQIRKCVITKQNSLYYRVTMKQIEVLRLYDTRQDPEKLRFT